MPKIEYINDDILNIVGNDTYILQQCNCLTVKPHGLSKDIGDKFSYAKVYSYRKQLGYKNLAVKEDRDIPGTYKLFINVDNDNDPIVVALYGQYDMGKCGKYYGERPKDYHDTIKNRLEWFRQSLFSFGEYISDNYSNDKKAKIYIPYKIGCGLAGGDWDKYLHIIEEFNNAFNETILTSIIQNNFY
jgi:hypothetical protein